MRSIVTAEPGTPWSGIDSRMYWTRRPDGVANGNSAS
jgi:hypothetical protein